MNTKKGKMQMPDKWTTISNEFNRINEVGKEFENQEAYRDYLKNALGQEIPGEMMESFIRDYVFDPDEEAQNVTPQSFSHFIAENGDRTIAKQMVRQAKKDTTKKEKENVQQKKAESKKSKNKTNSSTKNKAGARL